MHTSTPHEVFVSSSTRRSSTVDPTLLFAAGVLIALASCGKGTPPLQREAKAAAAAPQCTGPDVHQRHLSQFDCAVCHAVGGTFGFESAYTFPRGTTTQGGTLVLHTDAAPTTCTVACHFPMGSASRSITWNTPGPLDCTACHDTSTLAPAHPVVSATAARADCVACHDMGSHAVGNGAVVLVGHEPAWTDPASQSFHASPANRGLANCQQCHAPDLAGGVTGVACAQCHDQNLPAGVTSWKTNCVMCHGGTNDPTGAPPKAIWGYSADAVRVGAHGAHVTGSALAPPYDCGVCHVKPADALAAGHVDAVAAGDAPLATVTFAGIATQGLAPLGLSAEWNRTTATCASTYCHGATLSGGTLKSPVWTTLDGSQAACGTCHGTPPPWPHPSVEVTAGMKACSSCHPGTVDANGAVIPPSAGGRHLDGVVEGTGHPAGWMSTASAQFHAFSADANLAACQGCHGTNLDGVGSTATTSCATCHDQNLPAGVTSWKVNCIMCHGGTDDSSGAPPKAIWGYGGDPSRGGGTADPVRLGAHTAHARGISNGTALSPGFDCGVCHVKPATALSAGHVDGTTADVAFSGLASQGDFPSAPAWTRSSATCTNVYCHGASLHGGTNTTPTWAGGAAQAACGTCHGNPPPASIGHVQNLACDNCHPGYSQTSVNPATHVNGTVELVGLTCTTCHGNPARAATPLNPQLAAAPPLDTIGNDAPTAAGVGAHQAHLNNGPLGAALACTECHTVPTSTANHPTGMLVLTWGPLARARGATPWYSGGTCSSTYCHGATLNAGGTNHTPTWTGGSAEVACGSCHDVPPASPHPAVAGGLPACNGCHSATIDVDGALIPASAGGKHVDGIVQATGGHGASWMDEASSGFHAYSVEQGLGSCQGCHGPNLDGVGGTTSVSCAQCHDQNLPAGVTSWKRNCTMCHGGADNQTGAPPVATWGHAGDPARGGGTLDLVRVGAHTKHVQTALTTPIDCGACHVKPADALSATHLDRADGLATVTWGGMAIVGGAIPAWERTTGNCSSTYCHGNYAGVYNYTVWDFGADQPVPMMAPYAGASATPTWTGGATACRSCHDYPRAGADVWHSGQHANQTIPDGNECQLCHSDASSTGGVPTAITKTMLHLNGNVDVAARYRSVCFGCH